MSLLPACPVRFTRQQWAASLPSSNYGSEKFQAAKEMAPAASVDHCAPQETVKARSDPAVRAIQKNRVSGRPHPYVTCLIASGF